MSDLRYPPRADDKDRALDRLLEGLDDALPPLGFVNRVLAAVDAYEERRRVVSQAGWILGVAAALAFAALAASPQSPLLWASSALSGFVDLVLGGAAAVRTLAAAGLVAAIPAAAVTVFLLVLYARLVPAPKEVRS
jgi:hypothetical protein